METPDCCSQISFSTSSLLLPKIFLGIRFLIISNGKDCISVPTTRHKTHIQPGLECLGPSQQQRPLQSPLQQLFTPSERQTLEAAAPEEELAQGGLQGDSTHPANPNPSTQWKGRGVCPLHSVTR